MKNQYFCHGCRRPFDEPVFDGRCPHCGSYRWGDKDFYFAQQRAARDLANKKRKTVLKKIGEALSGKKKKKKKAKKR